MKKNRKKKWAAATSALALVVVASGTFAWFTSHDSKTNHFEAKVATGKDIEVEEEFTPPTDWEPGGEVNKDVAVVNVGQYDQLIRVSFEETLSLLKDHKAKSTPNEVILEGKTVNDIFLVPAATPGSEFKVSTLSTAAPKFTVAKGDFLGTYTLKVYEKEVNARYTYRYFFEKDGKLYSAEGISALNRDASNRVSWTTGTPAMLYIDLERRTPESKDWAQLKFGAIFAGAGANMWTVNGAVDEKIILTVNNITNDPTIADKWFYNSEDGYFYYTSKVAAGATTTQLVDAVTLDGLAGNEYSKLSYDLKVNGEGIQAFKSAVDQWLPNGGVLANALKDTVPAK